MLHRPALSNYSRLFALIGFKNKSLHLHSLFQPLHLVSALHQRSVLMIITSYLLSAITGNSDLAAISIHCRETEQGEGVKVCADMRGQRIRWIGVRKAFRA